MLVRTIEATAFGTNCWVLAAGRGEECLVLDPGFGVLDRLQEVLREARLRPAAILLSHGHADHVWSVTPLSRAGGGAVAVHVHVEDRYRLSDPLAQLSEQLRPMITAMLGPTERWQEPEHLLDLPSAAGGPGDPGGPVRLGVAGLELQVHHTPGHTEGSVVFHLPDAVDDDRAEGAGLLLSGDLLFAGSIGRSDLAGGDPVAMETSLRQVLPRFDDPVVVLPGHGPRTSMATERASNPYLLQLAGGAR